jgi:hypothetical protein
MARPGRPPSVHAIVLVVARALGPRRHVVLEDLRCVFGGFGTVLPGENWRFPSKLPKMLPNSPNASYIVLFRERETTFG